MPRDWDNESVRSGGRGYTTVRRYKVPERGGGGYDDERYETDIKITNREGERDVIYERDVDNGRGGRNVREIKVTREVDRAPSPPPPERAWRVERDDSRRNAPYELERYSRETEYVREPQPIIIRTEAPQPIIIREQAAQPQEIVIREERREPRYEMVEARSANNDRRSDDSRSVTNRSMVRRDPSPDSDEEDYYYKRTTRQVARRNDGREDERDNYRREVDPRDSASQYNDDRRDQQHSDDEYYYRKTTEEWDDRGERDGSPKHKLHLAEGALAGLAAGALLNRRQKAQGGKGGGAVQLAGGAALGAAAVEVITKLRQRSQSRGRRGGDGGSRSRSRSGGPHVSNLAKVGAVAAIGALAGYAINRNRRQKAANEERRSRSRHRRSSVNRDRGASGSSSGSDEERERGKSRQRNATIAKAGLATAAVAGIVDRVRSRSRGVQNRSLARQALPVAAAGLGGAAIAGLYQRNKEQKAAREAERSTSRPRRRSRSRSEPAGNYRGEPGTGGADQQNLVVYGGDPIPPAEQYARPRSRADSYYSDAGRRSRRGSPDSNGSNSPRHRSRSRHDAASGNTEASLRRERKRAERERRRMEEERNETPQGWGPYAQPNPIQAPPQQNQFYPQTNQFPPPPQTYSPVPVGNNYNYAPYNPTHYHNPSDYPAPAAATDAQQQTVPGVNGGQWYAQPGQQQQPHAGHYVSGAFHTSEQRDLGASSPTQQSAANEQRLTSRVVDGMSETRPSVELADPAQPRRKSVQFNHNPVSGTSAPPSDITERNEDDAGTSANRDQDNRNERGRDYQNRPLSTRQNRDRRSQSADDATPSRLRPSTQQRRKDDSRNSRHQRQRRTNNNGSEEVEVLPDRFYRDGTRRPEPTGDALADALQDMLSGQGPAGQMFHRFAGDLMGGRSSRR